MSEELGKLFSLPSPRQCIILARGPSLERYLPARHPGAVVLGVNDVGFHRHGQAHQDARCDYSVFIDRQFVEMQPLGTPIRADHYKDSHGGAGYWWYWSRDFPAEREAFGRTGSAALVIPWLWGCRDIWVYGMDAYPDSKEIGSAIVGVTNGTCNYRHTVKRQIEAVRHWDMSGVNWAHLEELACDA